MSPFIYSIQCLEQDIVQETVQLSHNILLPFYSDLCHPFQIQVHLRSFNANNAGRNFLVYLSSLMVFLREVSTEHFPCAGNDSGRWGHQFQQNIENTLLQAFILVGGALEK